MRLCGRALPRDALASWTVAQLRAEATLRGFDPSLCIERSEIEVMLSHPPHHSGTIDPADDAV
jgi:hypothetical protein